MSNIVKTLVSDGPTKAIIQVYLESDGIEEELVDYVLLDPVLDFLPIADQISILQIWYGLAGFSATLSFDDLTDFPSWTLPGDNDGYYDFRYFGGLKDRSGIDHTGKLLISTSGFSPQPKKGTIIIEIKKN